MGDEATKGVLSNSLHTLSQLGNLENQHQQHQQQHQQQQHFPSSMNNNDKILSQMDLLLVRERNAAALSGRDSNFLPTSNNNAFANGHADSANRNNMGNYPQKLQSTASMMASLEAIRHEELALRHENALRELQAQRAVAAMGPSSMPNNPNAMMGDLAPPLPGTVGGGLAEMERYAALFGVSGGRFPSVMGTNNNNSNNTEGGAASTMENPESVAANAMLARLQGFPPNGFPMSQLGGGGPLPATNPDGSVRNPQHMHLPVPHVPTPVVDKPPAEPDVVRPEEALENFLSEYGAPAEKCRDGLLNAISETEESLAAIHAWDRGQGLRKCHSRTVVKTRRSRAKIKAFLKGLEPPKEPAKKRKKPKKAKVKVKAKGGLE
eukprot:CAMPEP_0201671972 /NCGR_PEP_ID=MMETSP0494-20130426/31224_1 /ASSEMBLY_ACC=CAM_ASM_000839 /TAXON_ID=420259 /ORGANISM="Thalassiosira gravida, Strain GMp14c1" /LENGTH=378 /DNA_ID=CAMNT_0048153487 /DNA_START=9 /DNA_END=1145 /DNA_ORIENTATION=+